MSEKDNLGGIIFGVLLQQYAKENNIEPSKDEIDTFVYKSIEKEKQTQKQKSRRGQKAGGVRPIELTVKRKNTSLVK